MKRIDGRAADALRPIKFIPAYIKYPEGSVLVAFGDTKVLCNVTVEAGAPGWKVRQNLPGGWVTGEYALLPRATTERTRRETKGLRGRTQEIQRLIGRSLRAAVALEKLGERTLIVDCDVLQADGGTRTAAITGGYLALRLALRTLRAAGEVPPEVFLPPVAAISVGLVDGQPLLDLCYVEDARAQADLSVVMNARGEFIEVQGTAERGAFPRAALNQLLDLAEKGIGELLALQQTIA